MDPDNAHHAAAPDHLGNTEALAVQARMTMALAGAAEREGVDGDPLRDATRTIIKLAELEAARCLALVAEAEG